jgi:hypothetical protein
MRIPRTAAVAGAALLIGGLGTTAFAAGTLTPSSASPTAASTNLTVSWSGLVRPVGSSNAVFIQQCRATDAKATFNVQDDCSAATGINPAFSESGSAVFNVFNGDDPNLGEWGCGPLTTPGIPKTTVAGVDTCYVRMAPGSQANTTGDEFLAFTYQTTPPVDIPEVPLNILLPISAVALLGGAMVIARKRQSANV